MKTENNMMLRIYLDTIQEQIKVVSHLRTRSFDTSLGILKTMRSRVSFFGIYNLIEDHSISRMRINSLREQRDYLILEINDIKRRLNNSQQNGWQ